MATPGLGAGKLRERVIFQRRAQTPPNAMGGSQGDWYDVAGPRSARISPRAASGPSSETVIAQRLQGVNLYDVWCRYDGQTAKLTTDDRCIDTRDTSRVFNIRSIANIDERHRFLVFTCEQGVADG